MAYVYYSHKFEEEVPLLDEKEWEEFAPYLTSYWQNTMKRKTGTRYETPEFVEAADKYEKMTGYRPSSFDYQNYFRLSSYGRPCEKCQKPFRTPKAKICAECGYELPQGEIAGPITKQMMEIKRVVI